MLYVIREVNRLVMMEHELVQKSNVLTALAGQIPFRKFN